VNARWLVAIALLAGCEARPACGPRADHSVIACVGGDAVTRAEVEQHVRAPEPEPGHAALPDARAAALDEAVRVRLFAAEARRRGLAAPDGPPSKQLAILHQALLFDERAKLPPIGDDAAQAWYADHPGEVVEVSDVHCQAIYETDPARAEDLYRRAVGSDEAGFAALGGVDIGVVEHDGPKELIRLATSLRTSGAVAGPVALPDGRYVILRATDLMVALEPWSPELAVRVRHRMEREDERAALDALAAKLRATTPVRVFADELARVDVP